MFRGTSVAEIMWGVAAVALACAACRHPVTLSALVVVLISALVAVVNLRGARCRITLKRVIGLVAIVLVLPFCLATLVNWVNFGYPFIRPGSDGRIANAREVMTVTSVRTFAGPRGEVEFAAYSTIVPSEFRKQDRSNLDSFPVWGLLYVWCHRGLIPDQPASIAPADSDRLHTFLDQTGSLDPSFVRWERAGEYDGLIVEATGDDGQPLVFVSIDGRERDSLMRPHYEFLYEGTTLSARPKLLSSRRFYYDINGMDGREWAFFFPALASVALLVAIPLGRFGVWAWRVREKRDGPVC